MLAGSEQAVGFICAIANVSTSQEYLTQFPLPPLCLSPPCPACFVLSSVALPADLGFQLHPSLHRLNPNTSEWFYASKGSVWTVLEEIRLCRWLSKLWPHCFEGTRRSRAGECVGTGERSAQTCAPCWGSACQGCGNASGLSSAVENFLAPERGSLH